ncbi:hypothetical protein D3C75_224190 [compost metagenome]
MKIECTYAARYNGFAMQVDGVELEDQRFEAIEDAVLTHAVDFCDEDGYFEGDEVELERICKEAVSQHFEGEFEFVFEVDNFSS